MLFRSENVRAGGVTHFFPKAHLGADLRASFPQGGNSAQYDRRHRLLPDWIAVRDPAGDFGAAQVIEGAEVTSAFSLRRAGSAEKGAILSRERMAPFRSPKRTQGALPLDPAIASEQLEELRSLRNQVRCTWLRHESSASRYR